jgi:two-component system, OmpR family, sensor histidine kinase MtrB
VGSFRRRLVVTLVALVALTALALSVATYALASTSLRQRLITESTQLTNFNIGVLAGEALLERPTRAEVERSRLVDAFRLRGGAETVVDFGDGDPLISSLRFQSVPSLLSNELKGIVASGSVGYQWLTLLPDGDPYLVTGGRLQPNGPNFYFIFPAGGIEDALAGLRQALVAGGVIAVILAALAAGLLARQVLRPVRQASVAAGRIAEGDLSARVPGARGDEFGAWAAAFNRMASSLEEKVTQLQEVQERQRQFVSDVSHELRTPLTALVNEAAMLKSLLHDAAAGALAPDTKRVGELLVTDVRRLRALVDDLLEMSRLDAEAEEVTPSDFDLAGFLRTVVPMRAPSARLQLPSEAMPIRTDQRRLERILGNLLDNAREHAEGTAVEVSAGRAGESVLVDIADRGPGVSPEDLAHIFDRFYKADPSRHRGSSGLGLAIARENARLLGGTLEARLRGGGGLLFQLQLPVTGPLRSGDGSVTSGDELRVQPVGKGPGQQNSQEPRP